MTNERLQRKLMQTPRMSHRCGSPPLPTPAWEEVHNNPDQQGQGAHGRWGTPTGSWGHESCWDGQGCDVIAATQPLQEPLFAGSELAAPALSVLEELGGMQPDPGAVRGHGAELGAAVLAPTSLTPRRGAEQAGGGFWGSGWRASWGRGAGATAQSALMELLLLQGDCYFIGLFLAARPSWEEDGWVLSWERLFACCRSPGAGL